MILLDSTNSMISGGLWLTYSLIGIALLGMIIGIFVAMFQNMKEGGLTAIISVVAIVLIFVVGYSMSSNVVPETLKQFVGPSGYQLSSGGLITFYILAFVALVLMVSGLVKGIFTGN